MVFIINYKKIVLIIIVHNIFTKIVFNFNNNTYLFYDIYGAYKYELISLKVISFEQDFSILKGNL